MLGSTMKTVAAVLILALAAPACGTAPEGDSPAITDAVWRWTGSTGPGALEVDDPGRYTLEFLPHGRYDLRVDCNRGSGSYTVDGDRLTLEPGPMTMAACGANSLDSRFVELFIKTVRSSREGDVLVLELADDEGSMRFEMTPPVSLAGTSWLVRGYNNGRGGVVSVAGGSTLHFEFREDGAVSGSAGCNGFTGSYEVAGEALAMGPAAVTRKLCTGGGVMEQEAEFLAALASVASWEARGERLQLRRDDDALALDLVSAVTGSVTYRIRKALHPEATIRVALQDVSRADVAATLISEQVIRAEGKQVPIPFEITFDPSAIDPRMTYSVRATLHVGGEMIMTSTRRYPVITRDAPRYDVEIQLAPVGD